MRYLTLILSAATVAAFGALPAFAAPDCVMPGQAPVIPNGTTASMDQFKAAHVAVQSYVKSLESYQDCVEARIKMAPPDMKPEDKQKLRDQGNAAIDQAHGLSDAYMEQVKVFKARPPQQ